MKREIISEINSRLSALGIQVQRGNGTDIVISTEFLDAGWSTGSKKISYESAVFANEQENVVYMYEKTTEVGHGLSFGGGSGTSFQNGKTLFRKVKSVQYGPDGKEYEYTLDLGAIPKAVKETAKKYGWKFKTVLSRNKAQYPAGYIPVSVPPIQGNPSQGVPVQGSPARGQQTNQFPHSSGVYCSNCGMQMNKEAKFCDKCGKPAGPVMGTQYNNPQGAFYVQGNASFGSNAANRNKKSNSAGIFAFILLAIAAAIIFAIMSVNIVGWIILLVTILLFGILQGRLWRKGCFLSVVLWLLAAIILLLTLTFMSPESGSKANPEDSEDSGLAVKLPYEKTFTLNDGKSTGTFKLFVADENSFYADYKGEIICEFSVKFDTASLPADFKLKAEQAIETDASGKPSLDGLIMTVCSDSEAYHKSSLSYADYIYNNGNVRPYVETDGGTTNVDGEWIKRIAAKYPKMQVLRYNTNEVGLKKEGDYWSTESGKAFGLHPPVTEGNIPWDIILHDLGLD
ncbi:MAG: zinc ribbon domain-containing protein [Eubacteriales bacterium]|nr:zinc ribbon domain-containing protein [Eubacteriales bacterium]